MVAETLISVNWELKSCKIQQAVQKFSFFQLPILGIIQNWTPTRGMVLTTNHVHESNQLGEL
jgi:hypothetical protein